MSDENKISNDKSILEKYRKYECCVFIDFEYICAKYTMNLILKNWPQLKVMGHDFIILGHAHQTIAGFPQSLKTPWILGLTCKIPWKWICP